MVNSLRRARERLSVWWKFRRALVIALLAAFILTLFTFTDVALGASVRQTAPSITTQLASVLNTPATTIPTFQNIGMSEFGVTFWLIFLPMAFLLYLLLIGVEVAFGKKGVA